MYLFCNTGFGTGEEAIYRRLEDDVSVQVLMTLLGPDEVAGFSEVDRDQLSAALVAAIEANADIRRRLVEAVRVERESQRSEALRQRA